MSSEDETREPAKVDPQKLPREPIDLMRIQVAQQLDALADLTYAFRKLQKGTGRTGRGGGGDSDPETSDSHNEDGSPKMRGPAYYERQSKKRRRAVTRLPTPIFKGEPGERPEAHLLRTLDWFNAVGIVTDKSKLRNFKYTLDLAAREWFADFWDKNKVDLTWEGLTNEFSRYFSTQGRSLTHLHNAWKSFTFDPETMDIEDFI